jgi:hypothetical protein
MIAFSIWDGLMLNNYGVVDLLVAIVDRALDQVAVIKRKKQLKGMHCESLKFNVPFLIENSFILSLLSEPSSSGNKTEMTEAEVALKFADLQPWIEPYKNRAPYAIDYQSDRNYTAISAKVSELKARYVQLMTVDDDSSSSPEILQLTIAFDEADDLVYESSRGFDRSRLDILSKAANFVLADLPVVFLFISSNARVFDALHNKETNVTNKPVYMPYARLIMTDALSSPSYSDQLQGFVNTYARVQDSPRKTSPGLFAFFSDQERCRFTTLFRLGRPAWATMRDIDTTDVVKDRLVGTDKSALENPYFDQTIALAVLATRTNLLNSFLTVDHELACELVCSHLATAYDWSDDMNGMSIMYASEPIVAEAAAQVMSNTVYLVNMLIALNKKVRETTLRRPARVIAELCAQIVLLVAKDRAAVVKYGKPEEYYNDENKAVAAGTKQHKLAAAAHSLPVTVDEFLTALFGLANYRKYFEAKLNEKVRQAVVNFSHFVHKLDMLQQSGLFVNFLGRNAAGVFVDEAKEEVGMYSYYNLFVPIVCSDDEVGLLLFVVNRAGECLLNDEFIKVSVFAKFAKSLKY